MPTPVLARDCTRSEHRRKHEQRGRGGRRQTPDHRPAQGGVLLSGFTQAKAIGNMPAIMAQVVIKMGRKRLPAPSTAAAVDRARRAAAGSPQT